MKKIIILILVVIVCLAIYFLWAVLTSISREKSLIYFKIEPGQSLSAVADNLASQGLIRNSFIFKFYGRLRGWEKSLVAGNHLLDKSMNPQAIFKNIISSENLNNEKTITIIEGWRAEEIAAYLAASGVVSQADFLNEISTAKWREQYDFLAGVSAKTLEGFLFPDTYRIFADASAHDIVEKMLDNFNNKLTAQMRSDIASQKKNIFEVVNLAAIVEKEVPQDADKKLIADIFLKRLSIGMALQSDATINYITGKKTVAASLEDLKIDSPYNTYKYRGLPPGPIASPGLESLKAVIYPTKNPYYYFLTASADGRVIYSWTYAEHLANKAKYLN